jgi:SAM-dependent methyltransferase
MTGIRLTDEFRDLYTSVDFVDHINRDWMPLVLDGIDIGESVLDLAAGPPVVADVLRATGAGVKTADLESDVDPTALPFDDNSFSAATAIISLHHVPSAADQDRALAELHRVIRPGGVLAGLNAIDGPHFRRLNSDGRSIPIDPMTFTERLERSGFTDVRVSVWSFVRFTGRVAA